MKLFYTGYVTVHPTSLNSCGGEDHGIFSAFLSLGSDQLHTETVPLPIPYVPLDRYPTTTRQTFLALQLLKGDDLARQCGLSNRHQQQRRRRQP